MTRYFTPLLLVLLFACNEDEPTSAEEIQNEMQQILVEIDAITSISCSASSECKAQAIGVKPCGGPTHYIIYSELSNESQFDALVEDYNTLNTQYNEATQAGSDCAFVTEPSLDCVSGNCTVVD